MRKHITVYKIAMILKKMGRKYPEHKYILRDIVKEVEDYLKKIEYKYGCQEGILKNKCLSLYRYRSRRAG